MICFNCSKKIATPIDDLPRVTNVRTCGYCYSITDCLKDSCFVFNKELMTFNQRLSLAGFDTLKIKGVKHISRDGKALARPKNPSLLVGFVFDNYGIEI